MLVKLLVARATAKGAENRGDEIEVSDAEAIRMIDAGQAIPVAKVAAPEKAMKRTPRAEKRDA